jgi:polysaccharide biosynthesis/export protein
MGSLRILSGMAISAAWFAASGCSILPSAGPSSGDVRSAKPDSEIVPYAVVRITPEVEHVLASHSPRIAQTFTDRRGPNEIRFGVGDVLSVTIFESAAGGLFIPQEAGVRPGNFITLPNQSVDNSGNITVPYAGAIRTKGRTVVEVQEAIADALKARALEPQVVVAMVEQRASSISVLGDVVSPVRFPANASGERILDAVSRAGGPRVPGFDTKVLLDREGRQATVPFGALIYEPANNIYVRPQDTIYVYREPQTFLSFGASGTQGQFAFDAWRLSLAEAMARAGGLNDTLADPASVFLYRGEPRAVAELLGIDCARFTGPVIPVIYNLNLRDPSGYFLATQFDMRNKDVVFASTAASVEGTKFLTYIRLISATVNDPIVTAINAYTVRSLAQGVGNVSVVTTTTSPPIH